MNIDCSYGILLFSNCQLPLNSGWYLFSDAAVTENMSIDTKIRTNRRFPRINMKIAEAIESN